MNRIDPTVLLEIQTNLGYFEYKDNRTVGTYSTLNTQEQSIEIEDYVIYKPPSFSFCLNCNEKFTILNSRHRFCSDKCRDHFKYLKRRDKLIQLNSI